MIGGFQPLAFQPAYQQAGVTPPVVIGGGGWDLYPAWRKKTKKEVEEERERFGIIPKKVKDAIIDAAVQYASEPDKPPVMEAFDNATADFERKYESYFRYEVARQLRLLRQEEEEFMMLLH